jgi:quercetin 2,3-dioxygenase
MKTTIHRANTRGSANHGWLNAHHTFSFAGYFNPERIHFGALRVLNDDIVEPGMGFGMHPHDNMEIITIPLQGALQHRDNLGNSEVIHAGEIQVMSAGTGIVHSEFNPSDSEPVNLLQIWVFTKIKNVEPRYQQMPVPDFQNKFQLVVGPKDGEAKLWVYQDAWFSLGRFTENSTEIYFLKNSNNGVYLFVIEGKVKLGALELGKRDGMEITDVSEIELNVEKNSYILLMEVPMKM